MWVRAFIQLVCFIFFPSVFTAAFAGVKYIVAQIGAGEQISWTSFVAVLVFLCLFTILFGRFFCGFACAFGSLGDAAHGLYRFLCRKFKKKPWKIPQSWEKWLAAVPYIILTAIVFLCFCGIQGKLSGISPWETFSMLRAGNFKLGSHLAGFGILGILLVGMCIQERFFCRFFCPMGAVFSLLPVLPVCSIGRDRKQCIAGCSACSRNCPAQIELPESGNIHCNIPRIKGNEVLVTFVKMIILAGMFLWLEI